MSKAKRRGQKKRAKNPISQPDGPHAVDVAIQLFNSGELQRSANLLRQILQTEPRNPVALHVMGLAEYQAGKIEASIKWLVKATRAEPAYVEAQANLGNAFQDLGRLKEAVDCHRKAVSLAPDIAQLHNNLGTALQEMGEADQAIDSLNEALSLNADYAEAHCNLGNALSDLGRHDDAITHFRKALEIAPNLAAAQTNLGNALKKAGCLDEAVTAHKEALSNHPNAPEIHNNLGNALKEQGNLDDAKICYEEALALNSRFAEAHNNLGNVLFDLGRPDDAVKCYLKALELKPDYATAQSNRLLTEQYRLGNWHETLYQLHCQWDDQQGVKYRNVGPKLPTPTIPDKRLRIGFVSPDLGRHPVGYFIVGLLENLPDTDDETFCYSDRSPDDLTDRIRMASTHWRQVLGLSDDALAVQIGNDKIDILFDLAGHMDNNRLTLFARKVAPVQISWAGYVGTTGLKTMDYLISDRFSTGPEEEKFYTEKILYMPDGWLCYDPPDYAPDVSTPPCLNTGEVTFASFSNPGKINPEVIAVWAEILKETDESRLILKYRGIESSSFRSWVMTMFENQGIASSRIRLEGKSPHPDLLDLYNSVDIALDPFPYSGGLTTYEALWMGVPVITVPGETFASRHSFSHLSNLGLLELVAENTADYVKIAIDLARDTGRLTAYRTELRGKMRTSSLCDGKKFAQAFYRHMRNVWRDACA